MMFEGENTEGEEYMTKDKTKVETNLVVHMLSFVKTATRFLLIREWSALIINREDNFNN